MGQTHDTLCVHCNKPIRRVSNFEFEHDNGYWLCDPSDKEAGYATSNSNEF